MITTTYNVTPDERGVMGKLSPCFCCVFSHSEGVGFDPVEVVEGVTPGGQKMTERFTLNIKASK